MEPLNTIQVDSPETNASAPVRNSGIPKLLSRVGLVASPFVMIVAAYVWCDPFKVLWSYDNYYGTAQHVSLNREFVSIETYRKYAPVRDYDSFILGNSRSICYPWKDWASHIGSEKIIHLDASSESLLGIKEKLDYLDTRSRIANCLLVVDSSVFAIVTNQTGQLFVKHHRLSSQDPLTFHWVFFHAFLDKRFLLSYFDMKFRHQFRPYMREVLDERVFDYDPVHNELSLDSTVEREIREGTYYPKKTSVFYVRDGVPKQTPSVIGPRQVELLKQIRDILERHHTNVRIVISPLYNQVSFAADDLAVIKTLFGSENVFDFSGINEMTSHVENYYEDSHYRPHVARAIMNEIYRSPVLTKVR